MMEFLGYALVFAGGFLLGQSFLVLRANSKLLALKEEVEALNDRTEELLQEAINHVQESLAILDEINPSKAALIRRHIKIAKIGIKVIDGGEE
jgi:hypothetical protein